MNLGLSHGHCRLHSIPQTAILNGQISSHAQCCVRRISRQRRKILSRECSPCRGALQEGKVTEDDRRFMLQALELARRGLGKTEPNPAVGCVIVKDGKVVGEGYHPKAGQPHAEVYALRGAGHNAEGATAYVTLEPCNHYGKTPPCSQALVAAKMARVVVGVVDPNPLVGGEGIRTLEKAGIQVERVGGEEEQQCYDINESFMKRIEGGSKK